MISITMIHILYIYCPHQQLSKIYFWLKKGLLYEMKYNTFR